MFWETISAIASVSNNLGSFQVVFFCDGIEAENHSTKSFLSSIPYWGYF